MKQPKLRSINQTLAFLKQQDPDTAISYHTIMRDVKAGKIHSIKSGNRFLILLSDAYEYYYGIPLEQ